jgi:hypothetical protein
VIRRPRRALATLGTSAALALASVGASAAATASAATVPAAAATASGATVPAAAATASACPGCVIAGAGRVPLSVPDGTPLAGYGALARRLIVPDVFGRYPHAFWFRPATRDGASLWARALVLERDGTRVVWVALDLVAVDAAFT